MASAISGFINSIRTAVYGEQVRSAIIGALEACYSDVESPSLNQAAFTAAINEAYAGGILDIQTVTNFNDMTNDKIIYRYNGTAAGKQKGLYYFSALSNSWVLIGSEIQKVSLLSQMTDTNDIYKYIGTETGMMQNSLYCHNGTTWTPIGSGILTASTVAQMTNTAAIYKYTGNESGYKNNALYYYSGSEWVLVGSSEPFTKTIDGLVPHPTTRGTKKHFLGADGKWYYIAGAADNAANDEEGDEGENERITWETGYLHYTTASVVSSDQYKHSNILYGTFENVLSASSVEYFSSAALDYLSLFASNGDYLGTYSGAGNNAGYHTPGSPSASNKVDSISYARFVINSRSSGSYALKDNESETGAVKGDFSTYTIGVMGDSITSQGGGAGGYVTRLRADFGTVINYGISSTLICADPSYSNSFVERYQNMVNNLDILVVMGGINDYYHADEFGTADSTDTTTFYGALNVLVPALANKYLGKEVVFMTPLPAYYLGHSTDVNGPSGHPLKDFRDAIIEVCNRHGVQVLDLWAVSGMDLANSSTAREMFTNDGLHPNSDGHERIYRRLLNFLISTIR